MVSNFDMFDESGLDMSMMNPRQLSFQNRMAFARVCSLIQKLPKTDEAYDALLKLTNDAKRYMAMRNNDEPRIDEYSPNLSQLLYGGQQQINHNGASNDSVRERLRRKLHTRNMNRSVLSNAENGGFVRPNDSFRGNSKKKLLTRDINTSSLSHLKAGSSTSESDAFAMPNGSLRGNTKKKSQPKKTNTNSQSDSKSGSSSSEENESPVMPNDLLRKKKKLQKGDTKASNPKSGSSSSENEDPGPSISFGPAGVLDVIPEIQEDSDDSDVSTLSADRFILKDWSLIKDNNNLYLKGTKFNRKGVQLQKNFVTEKVMSRPEKQLIKTKCGEYKIEGYLTDTKNFIPSEIKEIFLKPDCFFPKQWKKVLGLWNTLEKTDNKPKEKPVNKKNVKKNNKGKKPTPKKTKNADKSKATPDPKGSSDSEMELADLPDSASYFEMPSTSLTPNGLLASIRKTSMNGRCTPPTNVFDNIYGKTTTPCSNSSAVDDIFELAPKNVSVVKRMAKAKLAPSGTKPSGPKSKPTNKVAVKPSVICEENNDLIDEVLKTVKSNPTQTPELFKKVFRSKEDLHNEEISSDEDSF